MITSGATMCGDDVGLCVLIPLPAKDESTGMETTYFVPGMVIPINTQAIQTKEGVAAFTHKCNQYMENYCEMTGLYSAPDTAAIRSFVEQHRRDMSATISASVVPSPVRNAFFEEAAVGWGCGHPMPTPHATHYVLLPIPIPDPGVVPCTIDACRDEYRRMRDSRLRAHARAMSLQDKSGHHVEALEGEGGGAEREDDGERVQGGGPWQEQEQAMEVFQPFPELERVDRTMNSEDLCASVPVAPGMRARVIGELNVYHKECCDILQAFLDVFEIVPYDLKEALPPIEQATPNATRGPKKEQSRALPASPVPSSERLESHQKTTAKNRKRNQKRRNRRNRRQQAAET